VKLHSKRTAECQKSPRPPLEKGEFQVESLRSVVFKIDRSTQKLTTGGIHYSIFDVGRSMFISFFFDLTGRPPKVGKFYWPADGLNTDT